MYASKYYSSFPLNIEINANLDGYISSYTVVQAVQVLMTPCSVESLLETKATIELTYVLGKGL
jgi:hypothetical protein